jgi:hypothetical protein
MQLAMSLIMVFVGAALVAFAALRIHAEPKAADGVESDWRGRHRVVAVLLAGPPSVFKQEPGTGQNTRTAGLLLGGVLLVLIGIAYLFV